MQWICSCGERHDEEFDNCWRCGAGKTGQDSGAAGAESASARSAGLTDVFGGGTREPAVPASQPLREVAADQPFPLLQDETVLEAIGMNAVVLTTHRIRAYGLGDGPSSFVSIMLEQVASSSKDLVTKPWMLGVASISFVLALTFAARHDDWWIPALVGIVFIVAYFLTRRVVVSISSAAASVQFSSSAASEMAVQAFINKLEHAKDLRYRLSSRT